MGSSQGQVAAIFLHLVEEIALLHKTE
jgi:hypothetical protein